MDRSFAIAVELTFVGTVTSWFNFAFRSSSSKFYSIAASNQHSKGLKQISLSYYFYLHLISVRIHFTYSHIIQNPRANGKLSGLVHQQNEIYKAKHFTATKKVHISFHTGKAPSDTYVSALS